MNKSTILAWKIEEAQNTPKGRTLSETFPLELEKVKIC